MSEYRLHWLKEDLAMFTEYQLATLEGLPNRTSKVQRARQVAIVEEMIAACRRAGITHAWRCPRLNNILADRA